MPKHRPRQIRRDQICRAAATLIAREGFAGTTMRRVAEQAGVSTGMVNHYFANRQDVLAEALIYVSERMQARVRTAIEDVPAGEERMRALLKAALPLDDETTETWRVWIAAYGLAVRSSDMRQRISERLEPWYDILDEAAEDVAPADAPSDSGPIPMSWRFDAMLNGLIVQALVARTGLNWEQICDEVIHVVRTGGRVTAEAPK